MIAAAGSVCLAAVLWLPSVGGPQLALAALQATPDAVNRDAAQSEAQQPKPVSEDSAQKRRRALDDTLLEGLEKELMEDLEKELFEGLDDKRKPPNASKPRDEALEELNEQLLRELDEAEDLPDEDEDPLSRIGRQMRLVEERIAEARTDEDTRAMQRRIVEELDKLLEMARRRQSQSSQSQSARPGSRRENVRQPGSQAAGGGNSQKPAGDSTPRLGQAEPHKPDPQAVRKLLEDLWGHLPEREREQVMSATMDQFLPRYAQLIEQYFKRLAEELREER